MDAGFIKLQIQRAGFTQASLAVEMGMTAATLNLKIHGRYEFTRAEMGQMAELLGTTAVKLFYEQGA